MLTRSTRWMVLGLALTLTASLAAESPEEAGPKRNKLPPANREQSEAWPTLEKLVPRCLLIVHCKAENVDGRVLYKVADVWKGEYSALAFVKQPPTGYILSNDDPPAAGTETILFFTRHNQPKEGISRYDMAIPVSDGQVTYPPGRQEGIDSAPIRLKEFRRTVVSLVEDKVSQELAQQPVKLERKSPALEGSWRMYLPAGFEHAIVLKPLGDNRYRLEPGSLNSSGVYEVRGDRLVLVEPREPHLKGFEWSIRSPYFLTLTGQASNTGSDYLGAVLFRGNDRKPAGK